MNYLCLYWYLLEDAFLSARLVLAFLLLPQLPKPICRVVAELFPLPQFARSLVLCQVCRASCPVLCLICPSGRPAAVVVGLTVGSSSSSSGSEFMAGAGENGEKVKQTVLLLVLRPYSRSDVAIKSSCAAGENKLKKSSQSRVAGVVGAVFSLTHGRCCFLTESANSVCLRGEKEVRGDGERERERERERKMYMRDWLCMAGWLAGKNSPINVTAGGRTKG